MSELISGKDALIALANGEEVQLQVLGDMNWHDSTQWTVGELLCFKGKFRLKPRTIYINGIEVPATFEPKCMEDFYVIDGTHSQGWVNGNPANPALSMENPKWRTEEEIKQVVAALRSIFGKK